jgi:hypothetical protein
MARPAGLFWALERTETRRAYSSLDENLIRALLSPAQVASAIFRRKAISMTPVRRVSRAKFNENIREGLMSKSKSLIKDKWTTLEVDKDGNFETVLIVSTKVILDSDDKHYNSEKLYRLVDEVKSNLGRCDRAHIFNPDDA